MNTLTDFDYQPHRSVAAAAALQKGVYHLFILRSDKQTDLYEHVVRSYQCVFQLSITLLLLDETFSLNHLLKPNPLKPNRLPPPLKALCDDAENPRRDEIDPASVVQHFVFAKRRWAGFSTAHTLAPIGKEALNLFSRVVEARHNLLYRPFLLDAATSPIFAISPYWEDCTLRALIGGAPSWQEIEAAYENFAAAIWEWRNGDRRSSIPLDFIIRLFEPYIDRSGERPTETVLLRYAHMLSGDDQAKLTGLPDYRNKLIGQAGHLVESGIGLPPEWRVGEI